MLKVNRITIEVVLLTLKRYITCANYLYNIYLIETEVFNVNILDIYLKKVVESIKVLIK